MPVPCALSRPQAGGYTEPIATRRGVEQMSTPNPRIRFTYEDYQTMPESMIGHYELLDGDIVMVPSSTTAHQRILRNLGYLLMQFIRRHGWGELFYAPCDVVLGQGKEREVVEPDLLFITRQRRHIVTEKEIQGAPDLVVEILSSGTEARDRGYKRVLYGRYGVREYWIIDPQTQSVEVYALGEEGLALQRTYGCAQTMESVLFPGMSIELAEVFRAD
jgi:Uma2 family endonuclease